MPHRQSTSKTSPPVPLQLFQPASSRGAHPPISQKKPTSRRSPVELGNIHPSLLPNPQRPVVPCTRRLPYGKPHEAPIHVRPAQVRPSLHQQVHESLMPLPRGVIKRRMPQRVADVHERPRLEQRARRAHRPVERCSVQWGPPGRGVRAVREPAADREGPTLVRVRVGAGVGVDGEGEGERFGVVARNGEVDEEGEERALGRRCLRRGPAPGRGRLVGFLVVRVDAVYEDARGAHCGGGRGEADDLREEALEVVEAWSG